MGLTRRKSPHLPGEETGDWPFRQEIHAIITGKVCWPELRKACRRQHEEFADWACQECTEYLKPEHISPWTWHLLFLYRLKTAGYPFKANDLSLETWLLLGEVELLIKSLKAGSARPINRN